MKKHLKPKSYVGKFESECSNILNQMFHITTRHKLLMIIQDWKTKTNPSLFIIYDSYNMTKRVG